MINYDLSTIPFSVAGSFLLFTSRGASNGRVLYKTCSHRPVAMQGVDFNSQDFFEIALFREGKEVLYTPLAFPFLLELTTQEGYTAQLTFSDQDTVLVRLDGIELRLVPRKPFSIEFAPSEDQLNLVDWPARGIHQFRPYPDSKIHAFDQGKSGKSTHWLDRIEKGISFTGKGGAFRFSLYESAWEEPLPDFSTVVNRWETEFSTWMAHMPAVPDRYVTASEHAWFLLWNCQVHSGGALTRPAIFMSKFWMNNIWAWDNCFNAMAIASTDPDLAWDQLLLFFDHQDPQGMVPDMINDLEPIFAFNKPPIHGWAIRKLVDRAGLENSLPYLSQIYAPLCRLTDWWYRLRDYDHDGMCQYHHGNDSGWDNATAFDQGYPTEGSDLATHLVLQAEGLAFIADALGQHENAAQWRKRSEIQLCNLLGQSVKNGRFFSPLDGKEIASECFSLLNYIPAVLGHRLPSDIHNALVADLASPDKFLTRYGLATEAVRSPKYEADGYWRGPIWAPSTYLIFDGLVDANDIPLARTIAERFCDLCARDNGFWENYDALTGNGLRCPGYSWTASVFLLMAEWLQKNP